MTNPRDISENLLPTSSPLREVFIRWTDRAGTRFFIMSAQLAAAGGVKLNSLDPGREDGAVGLELHVPPVFLQHGDELLAGELVEMPLVQGIRPSAVLRFGSSNDKDAVWFEERPGLGKEWLGVSHVFDRFDAGDNVKQRFAGELQIENVLIQEGDFRPGMMFPSVKDGVRVEFDADHFVRDIGNQFGAVAAACGDIQPASAAFAGERNALPVAVLPAFPMPFFNIRFFDAQFRVVMKKSSLVWMFALLVRHLALVWKEAVPRNFTFGLQGHLPI